MITRFAIRAALAGGCLFLATACGEGGGAGGKISADIGYFRITNQAEKTYPNLSPREARRRFAQQKFLELLAKRETPEDKRALAASFYLGYSMLNGRAIPAYCQKMRIDISSFERGFRNTNRREESSFDAVLAANGLTRDEMWKRVERRAMSAAKNELMSAGGLSAGSYGVCKDVEKDPYKYLNYASFARSFPTIAKVLNTPA